MAEDAQVEDAEAVGFRVAGEAFLAAEIVFREEAAISLEAREVFPEVVAVSLAAAVSSGAAALLAAPEAIYRTAATDFLVALMAVFPVAVLVFPVGAAPAPLDRTVWQTIRRCSQILADRDRVAVECHRIQPEVKRTPVHR